MATKTPEEKAKTLADANARRRNATIEGKMRKVAESLKLITDGIESDAKNRTGNIDKYTIGQAALVAEMQTAIKDYKKATKISLSPNQLSSKLNAQLKNVGEVAKKVKGLVVIPVQSELTNLYRFNLFYTASVKDIFTSISSNSTKAELISKTAVTEDGYRFNDQSYVNKEAVNNYFSAIVGAIGAGASFEQVKEQLTDFTGMSPSDQYGLEQMSQFLTTVFGQVGVDTDLFVPGADLGSKAEVTRRGKAAKAYSTLTENIGALKTGAAARTAIADILTAAKGGGSSITVTAGGALLNIDFSKTYNKKTATKMIYDHIRANAGNLKFDINDSSGSRYKIDEVSKSSKDEVGRVEMIRAAAALKGETKGRSDRNQAINVLRSVVVRSTDPPPATETPVFDENSINLISKMFLAAFTKLPEFEMSVIKGITGIGLTDNLLGSQALAVIRANMARAIESMVEMKIINASKSGEIAAPDAIYRRERKKFIDFGVPGAQSLPEIIEQILFSISPTGFNMDMTLLMAREQQAGLKIDGIDYKIQDENNFLDPNLTKHSNKTAQGDHAIALNNRGVAFPRNLTALSSAMNQSKSDHGAGNDQILMTARVYNDLLGEPDWTYQASLQEGVTTAKSLAGKITAAMIEEKRAKILMPADEIKQFRQDQTLATGLKTDFTMLGKINNIYTLYAGKYEEIQTGFTKVKNKIEKAKKASNKLINAISSGVTMKPSVLNNMIKDMEELYRDYNESVQDVTKNNLIDTYYTEAIATGKEIKKVLVEMDRVGDAIVYRARSEIDKAFEGLEDLNHAHRTSLLDQLNAAFSEFNNILSALANDVSLGEKAFRGSSLYRIQNPDKKKFPLKLPKPTNKVTTWSESQLGINEEEYLKQIIQWNQNEKQYLKITKAGSKSADKLSSLGDLSGAIDALIRANEFVLFSEFFT